MKKYFFAILMCCPLCCAAQSEWETPNAHKTTQSTKQDKSDKDNNPQMDLKDAKYLQEGIVPEVDGKVVFSHDIDMNGMPSAEIYDIAYASLDSLANDENQIQSGITLVNKKEHIIAAKYSEWLTFQKNFLSVDRTKFNYTIIAHCSDGKLHMTLERISYDYEKQRSSGFHTTAENWITDAKAVNKKHTKLAIGPAKFRRKTIDRVEEIFAYVGKKFKENKND